MSFWPWSHIPYWCEKASKEGRPLARLLDRSRLTLSFSLHWLQCAMRTYLTMKMMLMIAMMPSIHANLRGLYSVHTQHNNAQWNTHILFLKEDDLASLFMQPSLSSANLTQQTIVSCLHKVPEKCGIPKKKGFEQESKQAWKMEERYLYTCTMFVLYTEVELGLRTRTQYAWTALKGRSQ